jgi:hypothetical protein
MPHGPLAGEEARMSSLMVARTMETITEPADTGKASGNGPGADTVPHRDRRRRPRGRRAEDQDPEASKARQPRPADLVRPGLYVDMRV